jgi:hypothetical protein
MFYIVHIAQLMVLVLLLLLTEVSYARNNYCVKWGGRLLETTDMAAWKAFHTLGAAEVQERGVDCGCEADKVQRYRSCIKNTKIYDGGFSYTFVTYSTSKT